MNVLIIGGTGAVGSEVASLLARRGHMVRVMTRSPEKIRTLHPPVTGVVADLNDSESIRYAFDRIDALFLVTAHSIAETGQGLAAVHTALDAKVKRIVFMSAAMPPGATRIPHVSSKTPIEHALIMSRVEYTVLRPTHFFQNDMGLEEAISLNGVYPLPIGDVGVNRIDLRDVADAAVNALTHSGHEGRIYTLGGAEALTGDEIARRYSAFLERDVVYGGDDLNEWERTVAWRLPKWQRDDYRILYRYLQQNGLKLDVMNLLTAERVVGHEPRRFDGFVANIARNWRVGEREDERSLVAC
jgi:uncharacterized protein YbjT (DUF2867 family)